jgi:hypothetical protein
MPVVLSYDDPALVATLASQAGQYARGRDQFRQSQQALAQSQGMLDHQAAAAQHEYEFGQELRLQQQHADLEQQAFNQQQQTPWEESSANGATIYHAGGAPAGYGQGGGGGHSNRAPGYMHPVQGQLMHYVDQMEQGGHLDPAEAIRYRAIITAGGNPFEKPTLNEEIRKGTASKGGLTPYQSAQLGLSEERIKLDGERQKYSAKKNAITTELQGLREGLKGQGSYMLSPEDRKKKQDRIDELTGSLIDLGDAPDDNAGSTVHKFLQGVIGGAGGQQQQPQAGGANAAGSTVVHGAKPVSRSMIRQAIAFYMKGGRSPQAAAELAKDSARRHGFDPDNVTD